MIHTGSSSLAAGQRVLVEKRRRQFRSFFYENDTSHFIVRTGGLVGHHGAGIVVLDSSAVCLERASGSPCPDRFYKHS